MVHLRLWIRLPRTTRCRSVIFQSGQPLALFCTWRLFFDLTSRMRPTRLHGMCRALPSLWCGIKRLLRYLQSSIDFCLVFTGAAAQPLKWICSADGSLAPDDSRQSTGGYAVRLGDSLIAWKVVTAKCILLSTCECDLYFVFLGAKTMKWLVFWITAGNLICPWNTSVAN